VLGIIQISNLAQGALVLDQALEWKDFDGDLIFAIYLFIFPKVIFSTWVDRVVSEHLSFSCAFILPSFLVLVVESV
jgi:hypothetical protein